MCQRFLLICLLGFVIGHCGSFLHSTAQRISAGRTKPSSKESAFSLYAAREYFIPENLKSRLEKGMVNINELDRVFILNSFEIDNVKRPLSQSFVGFIIALEGGLVDVADVYVASFALFADFMGQPSPNPIEVVDLIGAEFREIVIGLGFNIGENEIPIYEERFYVIMKRVIQTMQVERVPGCDDFVKELIDDDNEIAVVTALPRDIAIMLLGKSRLSPLFEGKINPDNLVHHTIQNASITGEFNYGIGQTTQSSQLVECCYRMKKPSTLCLLIHSGRRNIITGKRLGMSCVALKGYAANIQYLRPADTIVDGFEKFSLREAYRIVRKAVSQADGPDQQAASVPVLIKSNRLLTAAPMMDRRPAKDTFAQEKGSDML